MEQKDLDEIHKFLALVGRAELYEYYAISSTASDAQVDDVITKRRKWAQGQQSNPKYKQEALFLIKNYALVRRVLLEEGASYRQHIQSHTQRNPQDELSGAIRRAVEGGQLTSVQEALLIKQGRELGLGDVAIQQQIARILGEEGATRQLDDSNEEPSDVDHYQVLDVESDASQEEIEEAYRARYKQARNVKDKKRSGDMMVALDAARRVLIDPTRRAAYDVQRRLLESAEENNTTTGVHEIISTVSKPYRNLAQTKSEPVKPEAVGRVNKVSPTSVPQADYVADDLLNHLPTPAQKIRLPERDPFAERGVRQQETFAPDDTENTVPGDVRDPFALGGSLNPTSLWKEPNGPKSLINDEDDDLPSDVIKPAPVAVPSPPPLKGRTIDISPEPQVIQQRPRLNVEGPMHYNLANPTGPVTISLKVRNEGIPPMNGKVTCREKWVDVSRLTLEPMLAEQVLVLTVHPDRAPGGSSTANLRIAVEHGEWRDITIHLDRPAARKSRVGIVVGVGVVFVFLVAVGLYFSQSRTTVEGDGGVGLAVVVAPYADTIKDNSTSEAKDLGAGQIFSIKRAVGTPTTLDVQTLGFKPVHQVVPGSDRNISTEILLDPDIDMGREPTGSHAERSANPAEQQLVSAQENALAHCFTGQGKISTRFRLWVAQSGMVQWVSVGDRQAAQADLRCLQRTFRGIRFPQLSVDDEIITIPTLTLSLPEPAAPK